MLSLVLFELWEMVLKLVFGRTFGVGKALYRILFRNYFASPGIEMLYCLTICVSTTMRCIGT